MTRRANPWWTLAVTALALVMLAPLLWMLLGSLKPSNLEVFGHPFALPSEITVGNYVRAVQDGRMGSYLVNSLWGTVLSAGLVVLLGAWAGYGLS